MRKKVGIIKRALSNLLIFLLSINSFAASVADNDGSAFITKAEFDALKSSFQSQIDAYNSGIDSKIDSAIASYLKGIQVGKTSTDKLIFSEWDEVTLMNGVIDPTFVVPKAYIEFDFNGTNVTGETGTNPAYKVLFGKWVASCDYNGVQIRPLCTGAKEDVLGYSGTDATKIAAKNAEAKKIVWDGIALNYQEFIRATRLTKYSGDPGYLCYPGYDNAMQTWRMTEFLMDGYYPDFETKENQNVLNPAGQWFSQRGAGTVHSQITFAGLYMAQTNKAEITLGEVGGKTRDYQHLINWREDSYWCLSDPTFSKTFSMCPLNPCTSETFFNAVAKNGNCTGMETNKITWHGSSGAISWETLARKSGDGTAFKRIPSFGMLNGTIAASDINQHNVTVEKTLKDGNTYQATPTGLNSGFQLFFANKDDEISWNIEFSDVYTDNGADVDEINVAFAMSPFGRAEATSSPIQLTTSSGLKPYVTTTGKKVTAKFKMPSSGLVWCKWWPNVNNTVLNSGWEATLDISKSKTYEITAKTE